MSRHGRHASTGPVVRPRWIYPTAIILGGAMIGSLSVLNQSHTLLSRASTTALTVAATACAHPAHVDVVSSPRIYDVVVAAADKAGENSCTSMTVSSEEPAVTANALAAGTGPDLWIPDSMMWATQVNGRGRGEVRPGPSLATSPLVIAVPTSLAVTKASWASLVDGQVPMRIADPVSTTSGRLALVAARQALGGDRAIDGPLGAGFVTLSRTAATSDSELLDTLVTNPSTASAFPVAEVTLRAFEKSHPAADAQTIVPSDGTARFDYPLLTRVGAPSAVTEAATALATQMLSPQMRARIRSAGLRTSVTEPITEAAGAPSVAPVYATLPSAAEMTTLFDDWTSAQTDARMLVVMDTSGSMARSASGITRIALAQEAADTALASVPDTSEMGLWTFSSRQNGSVDYREVVPIRGLADPVGAHTQRDALDAGFAEAARSVKGDTGLYDTVAAAYAHLQETYDPTLVNTLVVITDGTNDDPDGGLTMAQLISRLRDSDPTKHISVALVGITKDADVTALRAIASATNGRVYVADRADSIKTVLINALLSRRA